MPNTSDDTAKNADLRRAASRVTSQTLLRGMAVIADMHDNDLIQGLIYTAIWTANVEDLTSDANLSARYGELDGVPPDELRKPVSVFAVSAALRIPYETTRRYANKLVEKGLCVRVGRQGLIVPSEVFRRPEMLRATESAHQVLLDMLQGLRDIGYLPETPGE